MVKILTSLRDIDYLLFIMIKLMMRKIVIYVHTCLYLNTYIFIVIHKYIHTRLYMFIYIRVYTATCYLQIVPCDKFSRYLFKHL